MIYCLFFCLLSHLTVDEDANLYRKINMLSSPLGPYVSDHPSICFIGPWSEQTGYRTNLLSNTVVANSKDDFRKLHIYLTLLFKFSYPRPVAIIITNYLDSLLLCLLICNHSCKSSERHLVSAQSWCRKVLTGQSMSMCKSKSKVGSCSWEWPRGSLFNSYYTEV